jgi:quercetin dioxygenase-like cupin family protein
MSGSTGIFSLVATARNWLSRVARVHTKGDGHGRSINYDPLEICGLRFALKNGRNFENNKNGCCFNIKLCDTRGDRMIVKSNEAQRRGFLGVDFVLLSHGPESMVTKMLYKAGDAPPLHKHPNEQSGYVISGNYKISIGKVASTIGPGDSYSIPRDVEHRIEIIVPGEVLDFFSPPRMDYI